MTAKKSDLPYPFDQDFTTIVTRVDRKRPAARARLVNSVQVASYLKAGATLIERNLGMPRGGDAVPESERKPYWSGVRFLTDKAVITEMANNPEPFERRRGPGTFRATWAKHDDYVNDLLAFFFDAINYNTQYGAEVRTRGQWLLDEASFIDVIDRTTYHELQAICGMALFRLQLLMAATAHRNDGIHEVITGNYRGALEPWKAVYRATFEARGLQLRTGVSIDQFTDMVAAVTEGFAVRRLGDPTCWPELDNQQGNLLGMAVLGIVHSYLEPKGHPSGLTLRQQFAEVEKMARAQDERSSRE